MLPQLAQTASGGWLKARQTEHWAIVRTCRAAAAQ
jgi:hypothetical protein